MRKVLLGKPVTAADVEHLPADSGPGDFQRICTTVIARALSERLGRPVVPNVSEPIHSPDGGVDAEFISPEALNVDETGGLIGPGKTAFQFKYRDITARSRQTIVRSLIQKVAGEFPRVAGRFDRYVLM